MAFQKGLWLIYSPYHPNKYVNCNGSKTTPQRRAMETELHLLYHCKNPSFYLVAELQKSHKPCRFICLNKRDFFVSYRSFIYYVLKPSPVLL